MTNFYIDRIEDFVTIFEMENFFIEKIDDIYLSPVFEFVVMTEKEFNNLPEFKGF